MSKFELQLQTQITIIPEITCGALETSVAAIQKASKSNLEQRKAKLKESLQKLERIQTGLPGISKIIDDNDMKNEELVTQETRFQEMRSALQQMQTEIQELSTQSTSSENNSPELDILNRDQITNMVNQAVQKAIESAENVLSQERKQNETYIKQVINDYEQQLSQLKEQFISEKKQFIAEKKQLIVEKTQLTQLCQKTGQRDKMETQIKSQFENILTQIESSINNSSQIMDKTVDMNTSTSFWLSDQMEDDGAAQQKILSKDDVKTFIKEEMQSKKKELKQYFQEQQKWVQKQVKQLDKEREQVKNWTSQVQNHRRQMEDEKRLVRQEKNFVAQQVTVLNLRVQQMEQQEEYRNKQMAQFREEERVKAQSEWKQIREMKKVLKDQKVEIEQQKKDLENYREKVLTQVKKQIRLMNNETKQQQMNIANKKEFDDIQEKLSQQKIRELEKREEVIQNLKDALNIAKLKNNAKLKQLEQMQIWVNEIVDDVSTLTHGDPDQQRGRAHTLFYPNHRLQERKQRGWSEAKHEKILKKINHFLQVNLNKKSNNNCLKYIKYTRRTNSLTCRQTYDALAQTNRFAAFDGSPQRQSMRNTRSILMIYNQSISPKKNKNHVQRMTNESAHYAPVNVEEITDMHDSFIGGANNKQTMVHKNNKRFDQSIHINEGNQQQQQDDYQLDELDQMIEDLTKKQENANQLLIEQQNALHQNTIQMSNQNILDNSMMSYLDKENQILLAQKDNLNDSSVLNMTSILNSSTIHLHNKEKFIQMKQRKANRKSDESQNGSLGDNRNKPESQRYSEYQRVKSTLKRNQHLRQKTQQQQISRRDSNQNSDKTEDDPNMIPRESAGKLRWKQFMQAKNQQINEKKKVNNAKVM